MDSIVLALIYEEKEKYKSEKIRRRILRDKSDPFTLPDSDFINSFRLNKEAFVMVMNEIKPYIKEGSIPLVLQVGATLRFLAEGAYQRSVGKDYDVNLARTMICKILGKILPVLENRLCTKWINLIYTSEEQEQTKRFFYEKFGIPGVIGCLDGTHMKIIRPSEDAALYFNRKGVYSINAMIICDHKMIIRTIDACRPGSSHDSLIWNLSEARRYFLRKFEEGERGFWILGDSGYPLEPFLITPYRSPLARTRQSRFNQRHASLRNIVERTIGNLKSRFRILLGTAYYKPEKHVKIINVCCALHNICKHFNIDWSEEEEIDSNESNEDSDRNELHNEGSEIRDSICDSLDNIL